MDDLPVLSVYADGSSSGGSDGAIGWGWLITDWQQVLAAGTGGAPSGTNNVAELQGAIHGLRECLDRGLHKGARVELVSDSQYCLGLASGLYTAKKNQEIVKTLRLLVIETEAKCRWVRGHSGEPLNNRVDELARHGRSVYTEVRTGTKRDERRRRKAVRKKVEADHGNDDSGPDKAS